MCADTQWLHFFLICVSVLFNLIWSNILLFFDHNEYTIYQDRRYGNETIIWPVTSFRSFPLAFSISGVSAINILIIVFRRRSNRLKPTADDLERELKIYGGFISCINLVLFTPLYIIAIDGDQLGCFLFSIGYSITISLFGTVCAITASPLSRNIFTMCIICACIFYFIASISLIRVFDISKLISIVSFVFHLFFPVMGTNMSFRFQKRQRTFRYVYYSELVNSIVRLIMLILFIPQRMPENFY